MNDEQLGTRISSWLKEGNRPPPDPSASLRVAMHAAMKTRQLGRRWWLPPFLHRKPDPPSRSDGVDLTTDYYERSSIPATNGRTPTVIGRTQPMLTPAKAVTAGAIVFALAGVMLVAQLDRPPQAVIPGAAIDPCTTSIAPARGVLRWGYFAEPDRIIVTDSSEHVRGGTYVATMEMEDDRLDGRHTSSVEWDFSVGDAGPAANSSGPFDTARAGIFRGTMRIENEDGWWEGPWIATGESTYSWQSVTTLTGAEAYEGLSAMLFLDSSPEATTEVTGSIYPSDIASCEFTAGE